MGIRLFGDDVASVIEVFLVADAEEKLEAAFVLRDWVFESGVRKLAVLPE